MSRIVTNKSDRACSWTDISTRCEHDFDSQALVSISQQNDKGKENRELNSASLFKSSHRCVRSNLPARDQGQFVNCFTSPFAKRCSLSGEHCGQTLLLWSKLGSTNVTSSQFDAENSFEVSKNLLIRRGGTLLVVLYYCGGGVTLGSEILLCHLGFDLVPPLDNGLSHNRSNGFGLDYVIASVDLGQMLAFGLGSLIRR